MNKTILYLKNSNEPSNMAYSSKKAERRSYKDLLKYGESTNMIIEELETPEETNKGINRQLSIDISKHRR